MEETEKGESTVIDSWTDTKVTKRRVKTETTYSGSGDSITDDRGNSYDRVGDYDIGSDIVKHNGNSYKRR